MNRITALGAALLTLIATAACSAPAAPSTTQAPSAGGAAASPTAAAASTTAPARTPTTAAASAVRFTLTQPTEARFHARETFANRPLPNTAVGATKLVTGTLTLNGANIVPASSSITIDVNSLATDQARRDQYIKENTLEATKYPTFKFAPRQITGLTSLPTSGEAKFQLVGDLTVKDVTKPVTWDVTATFTPQQATGLATAIITFEQFNMEKPTTAVILSIEDEVKLELEFTATRQAS